MESIDHMEEEFRLLEGMGRRRWTRWLGGLLLVAGLAGGSYWWLARRPPEPRVLAPVTTTGLLIETPEPHAGQLAGPPTHFAWESVAGRSDYLFTLSEETGKVLILRTVKTAALDLTFEEARLLAPGKGYVWRVTARKVGGTPLGAGQSTFRF